MKIVFFGTPEFSASFLAALFDQPDLQVVGLVCQPDEPVGRKKILTAPPTKILAIAHDVPVFQPTKLKDPAFHQALADLQADVFVVVAYGRIIPQAVLDIPKYGCVNVHPSRLPQYRGPSPMQAAILHGDKETAVTIMKLDAGMDTGPILAQETLSIDPHETIVTLTANVVTLGVPLLAKTLRGYVGGTILPAPQDDAAATICSLINKEDGLIDATMSAEEIDRKARAYQGWPSVYTPTYKILDYRLRPELEPLEAGKLVSHNGELFLGTSTYPLQILRLQPVTKAPMDATSYMNGYMK